MCAVVGMAGHWRTGAQETARKVSKNQNSRKLPATKKELQARLRTKRESKEIVKQEVTVISHVEGSSRVESELEQKWKPFMSCITSYLSQIIGEDQKGFIYFNKLQWIQVATRSFTYILIALSYIRFLCLKQEVCPAYSIPRPVHHSQEKGLRGTGLCNSCRTNLWLPSGAWRVGSSGD